MEFIRDLAVVLVIAGAVGWLCKRIGLSLVVGYLIAGTIIGPYTPPFQLVTDVDRVQMLSQLGLVFLIFSIGLDLGLQRLRRLGLSVAFATFVGAILVLYASKLLGLALGWSSTQSLFVAGMLMVSSSAIISKVLQEMNAAHQRASQLALGVTVLEDIVAVVMLTLLSTVVQFGGDHSVQLSSVFGALGAFVVALLLVSLLVVPRLLLGLTRSGGTEIRTLLVIGLLLSLAWLAARAGYSLALGAFLFGVVVASTPQKPEIERVFEGIRDMFGAVFFVAMGMLVDFRLLAETWPLVCTLTAFALTIRPVATALGLTLSGNSIRDSLRAGLALAPLGEFSFIIAQIGVVAGAVPKAFYPMAVGASLFTTLLSPSLIRRSAAISARVDEALPVFVRDWVDFYHEWLGHIRRVQQRSPLWQLTGRRFAQTAVQILFVSALVLFAKPAYEWLDQRLGDGGWLFPHATLVLFWSSFGVVLLAPLVAIWRNLEALAMILAESATGETPDGTVMRPLLELALKVVAGALVVVWLLVLLPFGLSLVWASALVLGILGLLAAAFWRRLIRWHSLLESELQTQLKSALGPASGAKIVRALEERQDDWGLHAEEFILPDFAASAGRDIATLALRTRFGCSLVSIDRQGFLISNPSADVVLYPRDKLLLLGSTSQLEEAASELSVTRLDGADWEIEELSLEVIGVPPRCRQAGKSLAELDPIRRVGVQVAGIQRGDERTLTPDGTVRVLEGDRLLVLGTMRQIREFHEMLESSGPLRESEARIENY